MSQRFQLHEITGLGRPIDLSIQSNRIAVAGSGLAGLLALSLSWFRAGELELVSAGIVALGAFLAWALTREIDPDNQASAYLAMSAAGVIGLIAAPAALVVGVLLLAVRVLSGSVGTPLTALDLVVLLSAAIYAGTQPVAWPVVGLLAYAVHRSGHRYSRAVTLAMVFGAAAAALLFVAELAPGVPGAGFWLVLTGLFALGWRRIRNANVRSLADSGLPLLSNRVGVAALALITAVACGAVLAPNSVVTDLSPAIAAFAAMAVWPRRDPAPLETVDQPIAFIEAATPPAF